MYSFSSFHWMTYNFCFLEYFSFRSFGVFLRSLQMLLYFILLMLKVTLGSETITLATLSPKLWLILVISNNFIFIIFFCKEFVTSKVKGHWALNVWLLVKQSMNFVSNLQWYQILCPPQGMFISWYFLP